MSTARKLVKYTHNLGDGAIVDHIPKYLSENQADLVFDELLNQIPWTQFTYTVYDKKVKSPRLMYILNFSDDTKSDRESIDLSQLNVPGFTKMLDRIKKLTKLEFRYAVLNYYRDGNDYISYHSDREVSEGEKVASITVGATRRFYLKHKYRDGIKHTFMLEHGDLMILNDYAINFSYKHSVPKMKNVGPRINITLRQ
jgi:alkylated DNA repair dioxygenase AlkB